MGEIFIRFNSMKYICFYMVFHQFLRALVLIQIKSERLELFRIFCNKIKCIKELYEITGEYDVILEIEMESMKELYDLYRYMIGFEGIQSMNTHLVSNEWNR